MAYLGGTKGDTGIQIYNLSLMHYGNDLQGIILAPLLKDTFEDLQDAYRRHNKIVGVFNGSGVRIGIRTVSKVFKPTARVDEIHMRSLSLWTSVFIPFRKPLRFLGDRNGTNSILFSYCSTWTLVSGWISFASRTSRGITTWYLGEMVTAFITTSIDRRLV